MQKWFQRLGEFLRNEDGPTAVEYAVMLALIIAVCAATVRTLGQSVNSTFQDSTLHGAFTGS